MKTTLDSVSWRRLFMILGMLLIIRVLLELM